MLDCDDVLAPPAFDWDSAVPKAVLPEPLADFLNHRGPCAPRPDCRRSRIRIYFRSKAVLCLPDGGRLGAYVADVSGRGMRILSPRQLFPGDRADVLLPTGKILSIEVARCRRMNAQCYDCGGTFVT
jgi:hypothetical protein